jgi:transcriptional regulator with XRE-family HTH domain
VNVSKDTIKESETMVIGPRLRQLREQKQMSQRDVENRTGMFRCYISRVENGHTVPSLETLERFAGVFDVPLYLLFCSGEEAPPTPNLTPRKTLEEISADTGDKGQDVQLLLKLRKLVTRLAEPDRHVVLNLAQRLATHKESPSTIPA